jgi:hypothetical protein
METVQRLKNAQAILDYDKQNNKLSNEDLNEYDQEKISKLDASIKQMQTDLINSLSEKNKAPEKRTTHQV